MKLRPNNNRRTTLSDSSKFCSRKLMKNVFEGMKHILDASFAATSVGTSKRASNRTGSNREFLVREFFPSVLPLSASVRQGGTVVSAFGENTSRDVDILILNNWAAPIWPFLHGIVPAEGVLAAIAVERAFNRSSLYSALGQCVSVTAHLKSIRDPAEFVRMDRRSWRPVSGVWFWATGPKGLAEADTEKKLRAISKILGPALRETSRSLAAQSYLKDWKEYDLSFRRSLRKGWRAPKYERQKKGDSELSEQKRDAQLDQNDILEFQTYQQAIQAHLPRFFYFHDLGILLVHGQVRQRFEPRSDTPSRDRSPGTWRLCTYDEMEEVQLVDRPDKVWNHQERKLTLSTLEELKAAKDGPLIRSMYAVYSKSALRVLALDLARATTSYGSERPDYHKYAQRLSLRN